MVWPVQRKSGLIQRVKPSMTSASTEIYTPGSVISGDDKVKAQKDPNSPKAIPDIPTSEAPYDGLVGFGVMDIDTDLNGV